MMQLSIVGLAPVQYIPPPPTNAEFAVMVQPEIVGWLLLFPHSIAPPKTAELAVRTQLMIVGLEPLEHEIAPPENARRVDIQTDLDTALEVVKIQELHDYLGRHTVGYLTDHEDDPIIKKHIIDRHLASTLIRHPLITRLNASVPTL